METFTLTQEFIGLNQLLKRMDWVPSGGLANQLIMDGLVFRNGEVELRKRCKLYPGDVVEFEGMAVQILQRNDGEEGMHAE